MNKALKCFRNVFCSQRLKNTNILFLVVTSHKAGTAFSFLAIQDRSSNKLKRHCIYMSLWKSMGT